MSQASTILLRIGMSTVFLWFGISQLVSPNNWLGFLPDWTSKITFLTSTQFIYFNGGVEVILGLFLLVGFFTRISALLLALHLGVITYEVYVMGSPDLAVRDFGLVVATLAIALSPFHTHSIDSKYLSFLENKFPGFNKKDSHAK